MNGKWTFRPIKWLDGVHEIDVINDLFHYNQAHRPEEDV
eukprot:COSAG04_NODE_3676_length_2613_cov_7.238663_2_plen_39_part_00